MRVVKSIVRSPARPLWAALVDSSCGKLVWASLLKALIYSAVLFGKLLWTAHVGSSLFLSVCFSWAARVGRCSSGPLFWPLSGFFCDGKLFWGALMCVLPLHAALL